jgi:outer membrane lipoprotein-sorting protein
MKFLRTVSTRRLLATLGGVLVVIVAGTAIAMAAAGSGPIPQPASLADALHEGLSAPKVDGISASISYTNNLIDASNLQGSDPLLQGATGRLWYSPATRQLRLELQSDNGDAQVVIDQNRFWVSDPTSDTVYEGTLPMHTGSGKTTHDTVPSLARIQADLNKLAQHLDLSGAAPSDVAGQPTYTVRVSPKHDNGLLGAAQIAFDAAQGVPLDFAVYASGDSSPVIELKATGISFGAVSPSVFAISPPAGDKVVTVSQPSAHPHARTAHAKLRSGVAAVAAALPFTLASPASVAGRPRRAVTELDWAGEPAALVSYGHGIGGIAVIERIAGSHSPTTGGNSGNSALSLPSVSIDGLTGQELDTALGTAVMFRKGSVECTVIGSVSPAAAKAAATDIAKAL